MAETRNEKVSSYIEKQESGKEILRMLREILLSTELDETVKWGMPTYTIDNKNIVGLGSFKSYTGLWFHQGVFLNDPEDVLVNAQKGKTKALRQWRFQSADEIDKSLVKQYIEEAIENQKKGKELKTPKKKEFDIPPLLAEAFNNDKNLKSAFDELTHGKQRIYAEHIGDAKQKSTRERRLNKAIPLIKKGKGLHDKYK